MTLAPHSKIRCRLGFILATACFAAFIGSGEFVWGDEFFLASGGRVEGDWLNPHKTDAEAYRVRTKLGLTLKLDARQVREVQRHSAQRTDYQSRCEECRETADDHFRLAQWCHAQGLSEERTVHLQRCIELSPNHEQARHQLGQVYVDGEWTTIATLREEEGYIRYKGKWRTIQEIELFETQAKRELAEKEWSNRLKRWRSDLNGTQRAKSAWESIAAIRAPEAVRPLSQALAVEPLRQVKMLFTEVLASIQSAEAVAALVHCSLNDPDIEMFHDCLGKLLKLKLPTLSENYITALRDINNARLNRAALALGMIGDKSAISPLIDSLTTTHPVVQPGSGAAPPGGYSATFSKGGTDSLGSTSGGTSFVQNEEPKVTLVHAHNEAVLDALNKLSGGSDFGFDATAWRYWLAQERKRESQLVAPRRD